MSSVSIGRVRDRTVPAPSGSYRLGTFYRRTKIPNTGEFTPWVEDTTRPLMVAGSPVYDFAEYARCADFNNGRRRVYNVGRTFRSSRVVNTSPSSGAPFGNVTCISRDGLQKYEGSFRPNETTIGIPAGWMTPTSTISAKEAVFPDLTGDADRAWSKAKPRVQQAGGLNALLEARDIPRMLRTTARDFSDIWKAMGGRGGVDMQPKRIADSFLNAQFGWSPFLKDLRDFYHVYQNSDRMIEDLTSRNGRSVRRRVSLGTVSRETVIRSGTGEVFTPYSLGPQYYASNTATPTWQVTERYTKRVWAVGKFRFYNHHFDRGRSDYGSRWAAAMRQLDLYGVRISPSNVYNAIPWSWALDWFTNTGDFVDRFSDYVMDSVAAQYFYVMCHEKVERILTNTLHLTSGTVTLQVRRSTETKQRAQSTSPFGFNLTIGDLSPRQLAIAAALGISRS